MLGTARTSFLNQIKESQARSTVVISPNSSPKSKKYDELTQKTKIHRCGSSLHSNEFGSHSPRLKSDQKFLGECIKVNNLNSSRLPLTLKFTRTAIYSPIKCPLAQIFDMEEQHSNIIQNSTFQKNNVRSRPLSPIPNSPINLCLKKAQKSCRSQSSTQMKKRNEFHSDRLCNRRYSLNKLIYSNNRKSSFDSFESKSTTFQILPNQNLFNKSNFKKIQREQREEENFNKFSLDLNHTIKFFPPSFLSAQTDPKETTRDLSFSIVDINSQHSTAANDPPMLNKTEFQGFGFLPKVEQNELQNLCNELRQEVQNTKQEHPITDQFNFEFFGKQSPVCRVFNEGSLDSSEN